MPMPASARIQVTRSLTQFKNITQRTTAAAFHRYVAGEVVADSASLQWERRERAMPLKTAQEGSAVSADKTAMLS